MIFAEKECRNINRFESEDSFKLKLYKFNTVLFELSWKLSTML